MDLKRKVGAATPIVQRDAAELAGTPQAFRRVEIACVASYPVIAAMACWGLGRAVVDSPVVLPLGVVGGLLLADFVSGFVHWLFDTWGSPETPVIGRTLIRTFREHHVDEKAMTTHDFVETNGSNFLGAIALASVAIVIERTTEGRVGAVFAATLVSGSLLIGMTSQIHKWAHLEQPPALIGLLQRSRILLTAEHHAEHHSAPFDRHYCITCGWLNAPLSAIRFFRTLERTITAVTGALPRRDDIGKEAALAIVEADDEAVVPARATTEHARAD